MVIESKKLILTTDELGTYDGHSASDLGGKPGFHTFLIVHHSMSGDDKIDFRCWNLPDTSRDTWHKFAGFLAKKFNRHPFTEVRLIGIA